jgi:PAS domain S-box-containing protein
VHDQADASVPDLVRRVAERTAALDVALSNLEAQICQRTHAEAALRESEERYRRLVELSPEVVLVVGDDRLKYANATGVRLFGAKDVAELLFVPPLDLVHPSERERAEAGMRKLLSSGDSVREVGMRLVRLDGTPIEAELTCAAVNFDGRPALQVLVRDVAERRQMERMKDELLSIVSHELRTPLTSIRGSLGLLAGGVLGDISPRGQRMLEVAVTNADRLIRLLSDVLDLERLRAGRLNLEPRLRTARELIDEALAEMAGLAERAGVTLHVGKTEGTVNVDSDRMVQVLTNLVSNSLKFSPRGATVGLEASTNGHSVRFSVADHGRGIPPSMLDSIFERFQQVDASDSRLKGGTGIGLAICRTIVEQHNGRIWAESTFGQGSVFYVELDEAGLAAAA